MDIFFGFVLALFGWFYDGVKSIFNDLENHPWILVIVAVLYSLHVLEKQIDRRFDKLQIRLDMLSDRLTRRDTF